MQQLLNRDEDNNSHQENFNRDLCNLFVGCNIPIHKLDNPLFKNFLKTYCQENQAIPSSSNLRKKYVEASYKASIECIRKNIGNNPIWFSVDETTDVKGRYIANFIIGSLQENDCTSNKGYLISVKVLDKTNNLTITRFINDTLTNFYLPQQIALDNVLLMVSDAAPYMTKAAENLKIFFPKLIHCTCLAHGLNRVAETVRDEFPLVNSLVTNIKKVFVKAPLRVQVYNEKLPGIPLPPEPILTRWGTWLNCVNFIADNYAGIKDVICEFDPHSSISIKKCIDIFNNPALIKQVAHIQANYVCIAAAITKLEARGMPLHESTEIVKLLEEKINNSKVVAPKIKDKFEYVLNKNQGFKKLIKINDVIQGIDLDENVDNIELDPNVIVKFKFAPITSCEVERSFSAYKHILSDRRQSFTTDNLEKYLITYCFHSRTD